MIVVNFSSHRKLSSQMGFLELAFDITLKFNVQNGLKFQ